MVNAVSRQSPEANPTSLLVSLDVLPHLQYRHDNHTPEPILNHRLSKGRESPRPQGKANRQAAGTSVAPARLTLVLHVPIGKLLTCGHPRPQ
ncbi:Uncharacterised protein [Vibrio cholerae]|nr:Uncharacterised protein [Vibrio cholerae]